MGSKEKGLVLFIFLFILHMFSADGEQGISANVTETAMDTIRPNATLSKNEGSKAIISVSKRGSSGGGAHGGFGGFHGSSSGGFRGGNPGSGKSFGGGDNGGSASKSPRTPGSLIPVYGGVAGAAAAAARHNNHHSGASGPNQNQVGFGVVRVAILCPLVLMLCSLWS